LVDIITAPATPEAQQWEGWGTALKPANEPIVLARKPISEKTIADNVLKWGTGGINIDACRIEYQKGENPTVGGRHKKTGRRIGAGSEKFGFKSLENPEINLQGRFPANVIIDEEAARMLDEQQEGASRFFYVAKASRSERTMNGKIVNNHPTVKPIKLMRYLCRLVTPPGGTVLDPFAGSGTTILAAVQEGFSAIGIEKESEYCEIIRKRMAEVQPALPLVR
jgi:site-specific DNA-methyltransferase (adenine-specific)